MTILFTPTLLSAFLSGLSYYNAISEEVNACQKCLFDPLNEGTCNSTENANKSADAGDLVTTRNASVDAGTIDANTPGVSAGDTKVKNNNVSAGDTKAKNNNVNTNQGNNDKSVNTDDGNNNKNVSTSNGNNTNTVIIDDPDYTKQAIVN